MQQLVDRRDEITRRHDEASALAARRKPNKPVWEVLGDALDEDDDADQCTVCAL